MFISTSILISTSIVTSVKGGGDAKVLQQNTLVREAASSGHLFLAPVSETETRNQKLGIRKPKPGTRNQKPETRNQKPETRNQKLFILYHYSPA